MSHTITPVPQYDTASLVRTVDGELISDTSGPAPYGPLLQALADRALYARGGLWGQLLWSGRLAVDPGGSNTVFALKLGAISSVCVKDGSGVWRPYFTAAETTLTLAHVEGAPANLSNSTWYYVYAYSDGTTTLKFLINTTAPDATGLWQSAGGDGQRRYLGCFRTNGSGAPLPVVAHSGRYIYRVSDMAANATQVLAAGTQTSFTNVACTAFVPPHVRVVEINASLVPGASAAGAQVRMDGAAGAGVVPLSTSATHSAEKTFAMELSASQVLEYIITSGAPTGLYLDVMGFTE